MGVDEWSGRGWRIAVTPTDVTILRPHDVVMFSNSDVSTLLVRRRLMWLNLFNDGERVVRLRGIRKEEASKLGLAIRRLSFVRPLGEAMEWHAKVQEFMSGQVRRRRWITTEETDTLLKDRPAAGLRQKIRVAECDTLFGQDELDAAEFLELDVASLVNDANERFMVEELESHRQFFDTIEKSPLTVEQSRAVITFDNRVQILAAAGSGKTSVMVARAAYAVSRGFVRPDNILLLAFNKDAASELQQRVTSRFAQAGIDSTGIRASTFHSFGLEVVGRATGEKPRLAHWLEQGMDVEMVMRIVDDLRDSSPTFRYQWDLYRLLFANAPTELEENSPDGYDKATRAVGYKTLSGNVVKSHGERLIADYLFLNGVDFEYEKRYVHPTADADHSQYRPDFYYPTIDVWHEHWALDQDGKPPVEFEGYKHDMTWKRRTHIEHGTKLVESTWAQVMFEDGLSKLADELTSLGLTLDWNPDRPARDPWAKTMKHEELARLVRTFMSHVKSNSWSSHDIEHRLTTELTRRNGFRSRLFLDVYWPIHAEWEKRLADDSSVDFEDMLVRAANLLNSGGAESSFDLILVDEFQDASQARARLVKGLVTQPGRFLLAVGDDWQSINRFAGADISVMTSFEQWFGRGPQLALTTTFRCGQVICDVAREFVSKNPDQFKKQMRSARKEHADSVLIVRTDEENDYITSYLEKLSADVEQGIVVRESGNKVSVNILGRYGFQKDNLPKVFPSNLDVHFRTMHGSKGLESDYVIILGMTTGTYGFPSNITDDPVLELAMPRPESFAHAEERRLLYVALTRARREVVLVAPTNRMSRFVVELIKDPNVKVEKLKGVEVEMCQECGEGLMVIRTGRFGMFRACSNFPPCTNRRAM